MAAMATYELIFTILQVFLSSTMGKIQVSYFLPTKPHICQFWYTTVFFRPVKVHQKMRKFATKYQKLAQIGQIIMFSPPA